MPRNGGKCFHDLCCARKSYSDYDEFMYRYRLELADTVEDLQTILVNLAGGELLKPLHLKYLAKTE